MDVQGARHQWHPAIGLQDFLTNVSNLQRVVDMCYTAEFCSIDKAKMNDIMQWGLWTEKVLEGLTTASQREALAQALPSSPSAEGPSHSASVSDLHQARAWVLASMLRSAFLLQHPKPEALLMWIMAEYSELSKLQEPGEDQSRILGSFVEDAGHVVVSHGILAGLSHAYAALLVYTRGNELLLATPTPDSVRERARYTPCPYEMSLETAQKRAYASNCFTLLLAEYDKEVGKVEPGVLGERAKSFIRDMAEVARGDAVAIEVMCLALLMQPQKQTPCRNLPNIDLLRQALLEQVLTFREDPRLWSLDQWLLREVSGKFESFAEAYRNEAKRTELEFFWTS